MIWHRLLPAVVCLLLSACSGIQSTPQTLAGNNCMLLNDDQQLVVNLSREMVAESRLHAALANLETLPHDIDEVRLHKARILRQLGDSRAGGLYESLMGGCFVAEGHHGLGQLAAQDMRYDEAESHLRKAAQLIPVNSAMRNDLGLVYLNLRRLEDAQFELLTAIELDPLADEPVDNLLTLLIYQDQWQQAGAFVKKLSLPPDRFQQAETRARAMRLQDQRAGRTAPVNSALSQTVPLQLRYPKVEEHPTMPESRQ